MSGAARRPPRCCPICRRAPLPEGQRFCSARCQQIDLGRWLSGAYAVPLDDPPDPPGDEAER